MCLTCERYRAPELLFGVEKYHTAVDMWSVGCIFAELLLHHPLMPGKTELEQVQMIYELLGTPNDHIWPGFSRLPLVKNSTYKDVQKHKFNEIENIFNAYKPSCLDLMKRFLAYDPAKRISAGDAIKHPYFKETPLAVARELMPTFPPKCKYKQPMQKPITCIMSFQAFSFLKDICKNCTHSLLKLYFFKTYFAIRIY
ncbi:cell division protein kinase 11B isoform 8 [Reticulomyxa filosa]|uniref:Cyclin-dependent kinase 2 homolog n=1 Tax=Reticulomyxa filosa TaxID=46433 RepID=X6NW73_RETFI|nr:cell division protein kinase 11B isoform 8 [Reticulomyxa filosa]|eukprot:ETO30133.1 cell division protein kinase 11B isoform 8 [Reticulomyxa filosa]